MKLIVGLGNPGRRYRKTRHNIGYTVVDRIAKKWGVSFKKSRLKSLIAEGVYSDEKIVLAKPLTYMNLSGEAVRKIMKFYKLKSNDLLIISDDLNLRMGKIRIRKRGRSGGHKGLESIIENLNTFNFPRLRIGIAEGKSNCNVVDFVLGEFKREEKKIIEQSIDRAIRAIEEILCSGIEKAMSKYN